jgi:glutamate 5-kinase
VLLSDIDGLYDAPPDGNAGARHIPCVPRSTSSKSHAFGLQVTPPSP